MTRRAAALGAVVFVLAASCATAGRATPGTGAGGGPVEVRPSVEPRAGATITLSLSSVGSDAGSA